MRILVCSSRFIVEKDNHFYSTKYYIYSKVRIQKTSSISADHKILVLNKTLGLKTTVK